MNSGLLLVIFYIYENASMGSFIKSKKEKIQQFAHILASFIILTHSYEKYGAGEHSYPIFIVLGLTFLLIALFHHRLAKRFHFVDSVFLIIEAICYCIVAIDYFHAGKKGLPWSYVVTSAAYVIASFIKYKKGSKVKTKPAH